MLRRIRHSREEFSSFIPHISDSGNVSSSLVIRWTPPPEGSLKLNVDGSYLPSNSHMGTGGVIRDRKGSFVSRFSTFEGHGEILQSELLAVRNGLMLAWQAGYRKLICETDCLEVATLLNSNNNLEFHIFSNILKEIMDLLHCH